MEDYEDARRKERAAKRKKMRETRGQTQPEVAEAIGYGLRSYQKWEAGGGMRPKNRRALATFWDVPVSEIGHEDEDEMLIGLATTADVNRLEERLEEMQREMVRLLSERVPAARQDAGDREPPSRRPKRS